MTNINKWIKKGRKISHEHSNLDMTVKEMNRLHQQSQAETHSETEYNILVNAFLYGLARGYSAK